MSTQSCLRYRMEIDLSRPLPRLEPLPPGYRWAAWSPLLLERHAAAKAGSFFNQPDSELFPCLGELTGCRRLMSQIVRQQGFLPGATWLLQYQPEAGWPGVDCGTIQGVRRSRRLAAIQNVGITPAHQGQGLGRALVIKSLHGFRRHSVPRVYLEVTASNTRAVGLYESIGFRLTQSLYREFVPRSRKFGEDRAAGTYGEKLTVEESKIGMSV